MTSRRRKNNEDRASRARKTPRSFKWLVIFGLLAAVVYFLPTIICATPLANSLVRWATADVAGEVTVDRISAGWLSPVHLVDVRIQDNQGTIIASAASISTSKPLLGVLTHSAIGEIAIKSPRIDLQTRPGGSNLEDAFASYLEADSANSSLPVLTVKITGGHCTLKSEQQPMTSELNELNAEIRISGDNQPIDFQVAGKINTNRQTGSVESTGQLTASPTPDGSAGTCQVSFSQFPAEAANAIATRLGYRIAAAGDVNGQVEMGWENYFESMKLTASNLKIARMAVVAPDFIGNDQLRLEQLKVDGGIAFRGTAMQFDGLRFQSDVASGQCDGEFDLQQYMEASAAGRIPSADFHVNAQADVAAIVEMLRSTLRVRGDVKLQSGTATVQAFSHVEGQDRRLVLNIETNGLSAVSSGRQLEWDQPLRVTGVIRQTPETTVVENALLKSESIQITANASRSRGRLTVEGNLLQLKQQLDQMFDLAKLELRGSLSGNFNWQIPDGSVEGAQNVSQIDARGQFSFADFVVAMPGIGEFAEPQLDMNISASGRRSGPSSVQIDQAKLRVKAGNDVFVGTLLEPFEPGDWQRPCVLEAKLKGSIASWYRRLKPLIGTWDFDVDGRLVSNAVTSLHPKFVQLDNLNVELNSFAFDGFGARIREPKIVGNGEVRIDLEKNGFSSRNLTLASSSVSARTNQLDARLAEGNSTINGAVSFRGDVNRINKWFSQGQTRKSSQAFGMADGNLDFQSVQGGTRGQVRITFSDLKYASPVAGRAGQNNPRLASNQGNAAWNILWHEPAATIESDFLLSSDFDRVDFSKLFVNGTSAQLSSSGSISDLAGAMNVDASGRWNVDWNLVNGLLAEKTGGKIRVQGGEPSEFRLQGPLIPVSSTATEKPLVDRRLAGVTSLAWKQAQLFGLPMGAGRLDLELRDAVLHAKRTSIRLADGLLYVSGRVDLSGSEPVLMVDRGPLLDKVKITPDLCRNWLKYVTPMVADATSAQGRFSLESDGFRLPLYEPWLGQFQGNLSIDNGSIGAGPAGQQIISLTQTVGQIVRGKPFSGLQQAGSTWLSLPTQQIAVKYDQQQISNDGVQMNIGDATVTTRGTVGLDQKIQMTTDVPIVESWIAGNEWLKSLSGQSLRVPVHGTLSRPRIDQNALTKFSTQLLEKAATGRLTSEIGNFGTKLQDKANTEIKKGLDRLLGPIKPPGDN